MPIDNQTRKQEHQIFVSIQLYRTQRKKQNEIFSHASPIIKEIEELTRQKVVRELHDGLSQTVSALAMRINFARRLMSSDPVAARYEFEKVEDLVRDTTREIRHMIFILRPIPQDEFALAAALELLAEKMAGLFDLEIDLDLNDDLVNRMPSIHQRVVYAIVEEAIDSARKHNETEGLAVLLDSIDEQVLKLEVKALGEHALEKKQPFQAQELESIRKYCGLFKATA